ncbi:MAG: hypothetical protein HONBIEJF_00781 [Fimbriimonadaceae bacterium]|nr:hypothetical protein [Fimbriimonadaceae bacterium]
MRSVGSLAKHVAMASTFVCALALLPNASVSAVNRIYKISPLDLGSGFQINGEIRTNGKLGALGASDLIGWELRVTETSEIAFNPLNTHDVSSQLFVEQGIVKIPTSPDGILDGGRLKVYGNSRHYAAPADCSGAFTNGGESYYCYGADFGFLSLGLPNNGYHALGVANVGNTFDLLPVDFGYGTTMFGTITTNVADGPVHLVDWSIIVRHQSSKSFTPSNSRVIEMTAVTATQRTLKVHPRDGSLTPGRLVIGLPGLDPTLVILADFSIQSPYAFAGYVDPFNYQISGPLPLDDFGDRRVGQVMPILIKPFN